MSPPTRCVDLTRPAQGGGEAAAEVLLGDLGGAARRHWPGPVTPGSGRPRRRSRHSAEMVSDPRRRSPAFQDAPDVVRDLDPQTAEHVREVRHGEVPEVGGTFSKRAPVTGVARCITAAPANWPFLIRWTGRRSSFATRRDPGLRLPQEALEVPVQPARKRNDRCVQAVGAGNVLDGDRVVEKVAENTGSSVAVPWPGRRSSGRAGARVRRTRKKIPHVPASRRKIHGKFPHTQLLRRGRSMPQPAPEPRPPRTSLGDSTKPSCAT
ncbi:hypothetical protein JOF59_005911 [Streptomyces clavifer]|uniref:Uncharacterized protein n=1 Tax=Streptomyces clavifer TaxID=68188 RepID=A0ABS4VHM7_9ACTN|nr:hypothetical protein [Streptomyces clavifer]